MQTAQFEAPIYADHAFPIVFHEDYLSSRRRTIYTNWHAGIELLFFQEGAASILLDTQRYAYTAGDIAIIGGYVIHSIIADSRDCLYYCLIVDAGWLNTWRFPIDASLLPRIQDDTCWAYLKAIVAEFDRAEPMYKQAILAHVAGLFTRLYRSYRSNTQPQTGSGSKRTNHAVLKALDYIHNNLSENLTIDTICAQVGLSKYHFCRLFKAYTDISVIQYINLQRCMKARQLMVVEHFTVSQAAREMNIQNLSYFTRMYKKYMGVLPSDEIADSSGKERPGGVRGIR